MQFLVKLFTSLFRKQVVAAKVTDNARKPNPKPTPSPSMGPPKPPGLLGVPGLPGLPGLLDPPGMESPGLLSRTTNLHVQPSTNSISSSVSSIGSSNGKRV